MKKREKSTFLKWAVLFVLAFVLSVPGMTEISFAAANNYTVTVASGLVCCKHGCLSGFQRYNFYSLH